MLTKCNVVSCMESWDKNVSGKAGKVCSSVRSIVPTLMLIDKYALVVLHINTRGDAGSTYRNSLYCLQLFCKTKIISKWEVKNIFSHWTVSRNHPVVITTICPFLEQGCMLDKTLVLEPGYTLNSCLGHLWAVLWASFLSIPVSVFSSIKRKIRWLRERQGLLCIKHKQQGKVSYHWHNSHSVYHCWMTESMTQGFC